MKLPSNKPEDEKFIKRAHEDPNWPENLDKPVDWSKVSLASKIWFKIGDTVKMIASLTIIMVLAVSCMKYFEAGDGMDEPVCTPSPKGCYE